MEYLLVAVLAWAFIIRLPRFNEPLAADYGAHFYLAQRWADGVVLYRDVDGAKPLLLYYLNVLIYKFWGRTPSAIRAFFAIYNLATVALVFFLSRRLFGPEAALTAAFLFATISALPHFWGSFSHPENYMMLPLVASLYAYISGAESGSLALFVISGFLCGIAYLFKQTALLNFFVLLSHAIIFRGDISLAAALAGSFILPLAAPMAYFGSKGALCLRRYIHVVFQVCGIISKGGPAHYVKMRHRQSISDDLKRVRGYLGPVASLSAVFWVAAIVGWIGSKDQWTTMLMAWMASAAIAGAAQRTYFPCHFLPAVPAASVLAGWTIAMLIGGAPQLKGGLSGAYGAAVLFSSVILLFWSARLAIYLYQFSFTYSHSEALFRLLGPWSAKWIAAAEIGNHIKANSGPDDYVLQWGEEPEIYFYSDRKSAARTMFSHPPLPGWDKELVDSINSKRPKFIAFMEQDLKMEDLQRAIEPRYKLEKIFHGQFKLYRRDDAPANKDRLFAPPSVGGQKTAASAETEPEAELTSITILTYNELAYTKQCIDSVIKYTDQPYELIIVDNGSTDGTQDYLKSLPGVRLILNGSNYGFAKGNNQGIAAAKGELILLLNNDVVVTPRWLEGLQRAIRESADIGMAGPRSNYVSGPQLDPATRYRTMEDMVRYSEEVSRLNRGSRRETDRLVGFCLLIKKELLQKIGAFDERFASGNFEDDDLCLRARLAGYRLIIAHDVFVHHFGSRTFIGNKIDYASSLENNKKLFFEKWGMAQSSDGLAGGRSDEANKAARYFNSSGMSLSKEGKSSEAKAAFQKAIMADDKFADGWSNLGVIEWGEGLRDEAFDKFKIATSHDILNLNALANLVATGLELGNYGTVEAALKRHREQKPDNIEATFWLASCYHLQGRDEKAEEMVEEILRIDSHHQGALALRDEILACAKGGDGVGRG